jgi:hypothetical protein
LFINDLDMALVLLIIRQTMKAFATMKFASLGLSVMLVLAGCGSVQWQAKPALLDNTAFMQLWETYRHCKAGSDVDAMQEDAQQLTRAALLQEQPALNPPFPLPEFVKRVVVQTAPRLAADPKAMAASCALSTGHVALRMERLELATGLFRGVLRNHPQPDYAFYADQARLGLELVDQAVRFARQDGLSAPAVLQVSSETPSPRTGPSVLSKD